MSSHYQRQYYIFSKYFVFVVAAAKACSRWLRDLNKLVSWCPVIPASVTPILNSQFGVYNIKLFRHLNSNPRIINSTNKIMFYVLLPSVPQVLYILRCVINKIIYSKCWRREEFKPCLRSQFTQRGHRCGERKQRERLWSLLPCWTASLGTRPRATPPTRTAGSSGSRTSETPSWEYWEYTHNTYFPPNYGRADGLWRCLTVSHLTDLTPGDFLLQREHLYMVTGEAGLPLLWLLRLEAQDWLLWYFPLEGTTSSSSVSLHGSLSWISVSVLLRDSTMLSSR